MFDSTASAGAGTLSKMEEDASDHDGLAFIVLSVNSYGIEIPLTGGVPSHKEIVAEIVRGSNSKGEVEIG